MASHRAVLAVLSVVALVSVACRGGDGAAPQEGKGGIKVDFGVTSEPCPDTGHSDRGCIYLGSISDLTEGPFKTLAVPITESQKAFWKRVNDQGGIGGYDVDVTTHVKDNKYNPQIHNQVYQEMKGKVLALAQTLGSPTTAAILPDLESTQMVSVPASWTSLWGVEEVVLESGANYCVESMNSVDYAVDELGAKSVMAVHLPGDYGDDAAAGAKIAAEKRGVTFTNAVTQTGQDNQGGVIDAVLANKPDVVILTTGPTDAAVIIGQTAARGFKGKFIGTSPTWNQGLMQSPAAPAIKALYLQSAPWKSWATDSPGHKALRDALPTVTPNDGYTAGWVWSYPLKAALAKAAENKDLTRAGVLAAVRQLDKVDYEGMLPEGAGNFAGNSNDAAFRQTLIYKPDEQAATGVGLVEDFFTGPTAKDFKFEKPCYT
ncbi:amino acid/amide ABC transporter substrate-binding protein (HAAT family) [Saccharothrix carnea]|uniref:Amino acid/amide ABC transporter substrate-binding protein (HAAT family) n=1 Tax=Saccharothrix carnea TaxID=1280637 RepID=A0A2P8I3X5_SACCR|nr:ABC transporter substrate-binding protein [Saccharothrix carnea]PSL53158.1 amino acid/amide ABC transporter substrate-binding protein (HAAT family) [Saccharothrix carnea]